MSVRFENIIREIAEKANFIRIDMIPFFKDYIERHQTPLNRLKKAYKISRARSSTKIVSSNVAAYLIKKGTQLLYDWLNFMFYFRRSDLEISLKQGGTSMDAIMNIRYHYNEEEIETIKQVIQDYNLKEKDINIDDICLLLLSEAIMCMQGSFNEIIGYQFSLMMQNDEVNISKNCIEVELEVVTRLYS
jgi:hypothetical protein